MLYRQKNIYVRSPLRVSFAGGGTDLEEFFLQQEGHVVSTTIPLYVFISLKDMFDANVRVHHAEIETEPISSRIRHKVVRTALENFGLFRGVEVVMTSDIMTTGSGLGASSAAMSALAVACSSFRGQPIPPAPELAELVYRLEKESGVSGGKQDQYATIYGGLNSITFSPGKVTVTPLSITAEVRQEIEDRSLLIYTNLARTAVSIQESLKETITSKKSGKYMEQILAFSYEIRDILTSPKPDLDALGKIFHEGWLMKQQLTEYVSNPYITQLYDWLREHGVLGGKILGAGGGGFFFAYTKSKDARDKLMYNLYPNFIGIEFKFCDKGTEILWKNY